ncbi:LptF/LptG family permease [Candidatus Margulisiibacteriota bacterium]
MASGIKHLVLRRVNILDRYILGQFLGPFVLSVCGFALIAAIDILFYLVELTVISGVPFLTVMRLLVYKLPGIMVLFFPMAVLFAVMLLLVRMAKDNELTVLRSSGVSTFRILIPIFIIFIAISYLSFFTNEQIVPWTNETSDRLIRQEIQKRPPPTIVENVVFKDGEGRFFYIKNIDSKDQIMKDILIFYQTLRFPRIITAEEARWDKTSWTLINGQVQEIDENGLIEFVDRFSEMVIHVADEVSTFYRHRKSARQMDSGELKEKISILHKGGISTRALKVEFHLKKSLPTACLIFGITGIALCLSFVRSGKDWWGVIIAICVAVLSVGLYFFILAVSRALAKDGILLPFVGAWAPNIIYGLSSVVFIAYRCIYK